MDGLEIELAEHSMRAGQVAARRIQLNYLDRVFGEMAELQQDEGEQERKEAVVLVLPDVLERKDENPGQDRHRHDAVEGVALDDGADLKQIRDGCGDEHHSDR